MFLSHNSADSSTARTNRCLVRRLTDTTTIGSLVMSSGHLSLLGIFRPSERGQAIRNMRVCLIAAITCMPLCSMQLQKIV